MSAPFLIVNPIFEAFVKGTNAPLSNGFVQFYAAGTTTPQPVYSDPGCSNPLANPVPLDTNGRATIYGNSIYDVYVYDSNMVLQYTILTVSWTPGTSASTQQSDWLSQTGSLLYISATSFSIAGNQTGIFHPGRRIKATVTAGIIYGDILTSSFGTATTITVAWDSGSLDSGLSAVAVGLIDSQNTSLPTLNPLPSTTGGTTAYNLTVQRGGLLKGVRFQAIINATNTGPSTVAINGGSATAIKKHGAVALEAGDMQINAVHDFEYDGTNLQLLNPYMVDGAQIAAGAISGNSLSGIGSNNAVVLAAVEASSANINLPSAGVWLIRASVNGLLGSAGGAIGVLQLKVAGTVVGTTSSVGNGGDWPSQGDYVDCSGSILYTAGAPGNVALTIAHTGGGGGLVGTPVFEADAIKIS